MTDPTVSTVSPALTAEKPAAAGVGMQRAKRLHRLSIGTLCVVLLLFLPGTVAFDLGVVVDRILYGALTAAALFFMFSTMNVMIHKSA